MNSSHYVDVNHVTQSCNLTHLIYGGGPPLPAPPCHPFPALRSLSAHNSTPLHSRLSLSINSLCMSQCVVQAAANMHNEVHRLLLLWCKSEESGARLEGGTLLLRMSVGRGGMTISRWLEVFGLFTSMHMQGKISFYYKGTWLSCI